MGVIPAKLLPEWIDQLIITWTVVGKAITDSRFHIVNYEV